MFSGPGVELSENSMKCHELTSFSGLPAAIISSEESGLEARRVQLASPWSPVRRATTSSGEILGFDKDKLVVRYLQDTIRVAALPESEILCPISSKVVMVILLLGIE